MKKLLLLLMALTLFAPPRANAQVMTTQALNGNQTHGVTQMNFNSKAYANSTAGKHNEGAFTVAYNTETNTTYSCGRGGFMAGVMTYSNGRLGPATANVVAMQVAANLNNSTSATRGADKFQTIFEVKAPNKGVYYRASTSGEIVIPAGTKVHFRTLGGPISAIRIEIYRNGDYLDSKYGSIAEAASWKSDEATITATTSTGWVEIKPSNENCTELTVDLGEEKIWVFKEMYADWYPLAEADLPVPEAPTKFIINGKEYEADENGIVNVTVEGITRIKALLPKYASNIYIQSPNQVLSTAANPSSTLATAVHAPYPVFELSASPNGNTSFTVVGGTVAPSTAYTTILPVYDMNEAALINSYGYPAAGNKQVVYVRSWNPKHLSEKTTALVFTRPSDTGNSSYTPEIDADNLPEGCSWDASTNTYSYSKIGDKIRIKSIPYINYFCYDITGSTSTSISSNKTMVTDPDNIEFSFKLPVDPVHNQLTKVTLQIYDGANSTTGKSKVLTFFAKYTGGEVEGGATPTIQAPLVSHDSKALTTTLAGGVTGFINDDLKLKIESLAGEDKTEDFEYQWHEASDGVWSQTPNSEWKKWPADGLSISETGRLFVREVKEGYESQTASRDFSKISTKVTDLGLADVNDGDVITLNDFDQYNVVGRYETVKPNDVNVSAGTWFVYLTDKDGRAIKMIVEGENETVKSYTDGKSINNITGVVRGIESGLPELWITTSAMDYSAFLPNPDDVTYFTSTTKEVTEIERGDFNKKVVLRNVTFNAADNVLKTSTGNVVKPYARLLTDPTFAVIMGLSEGPTYSVEGFVGYANGEMVLLPTGAIATPKLLAPNPITATDEDKANGYITVNVVSDVVTITPDITGVRSGTALIYSKNDVEQPILSEIVNDNAKIEITADDYVDDENLGKVCTLKVSYNRNNIGGEWVEIRFVKKEAVAVASIADFKAKYPDNADSKDGKIYRFEGKALVREKTPKYLYLRDLKDDGTEFDKDELSAHSILLYNENGWEAPVAMNAREDEAPRKLEKGDIITNFAFEASRTELQNLRGDNTGYARTLRRIAGEPVEYKPQVKDILEEENNNALTPFTEADRMVRYKINGVTVSKSLAEDGSEVFTLNMAGNPVLNIGEVFEIRKGFSTAYLAGARYNIDGVVLRNGDAGNYAVALIDFSIDGQEPLAEPKLTITGEGVEGDKFLTTATVEMKYTGDVEGVAIYYTLDNSNPRLNNTGRKEYTGPFEISATTIVKAYAAKGGEIPSEVAEATYTRAANERRYIVNFLDQAEAGVPYHFSGTARVVAKGGEYIFVRGTQGHYLPIHIEDEALLESIKEGSYVSDFVMEAHIINTDSKEIVRGAHVTAEYASLFATPSDTKPAGLDKDIEMVPDEVTTITDANARRYVKIMGVKLTGTEFEAEGDETSALDTDWTLTTNKGEGEQIHVNHNILTPTFNWDDATPAAYYNITGFAMFDEYDGVIELWPVEVEKVKSSEPVVAVIKDNVTIPAQTVDGITTVEFYPYTTVTLNCPISNPKSATIYYNVSSTPIVPGPDTEWNVYAQPFAITSTSYITMYATAPGYEQSLYTRVEATLGKPAGTVAFSVTANPGSTAVKMTAAEGADIYYTTDANIAEENWTKVANGASVSFTEQTTLRAYAKEGNKKGAVSSMLVMVMPEQTTTPENPGQPDPTKVSGKVKVELDTESDLTKVTITLSPAEALADGTYQIWYAFNPTEECVPGTDGNMTPYTGPIERKEGGRLVAILVENGKAAGEPADRYITLIPTDIDGIDADKRDAVRVEAGSIIAPEGSAVFDITGRRVSTTGLRAGIYIVRTPGGKAVKVKAD